MILPIIQVPDERLRRQCVPVTEFGPLLEDLARSMAETRQQSKAFGLAAPQVGKTIRLISINPGSTIGFPFMVNPEIIAHGKNKTAGMEGCLSIEQGRKFFRVHRWDTITIRFQTIAGEPKEMMARDMNALNWVVTGDTLKFSDRRLLRDGQHRLFACVNSEESFVTHIVFGIGDEYFSRMDIGKKRTVGDILSIAGYKSTNSLHAMVRWHWLFETGRVKTRDTITPEEAKAWLQRHPRLPDFTPQAMRIAKSHDEPVGLVGAILYATHLLNERRSIEFAAALESGAWGGRAKPIGKMKQEIARIKGQSSGRIHDVVRAAFYVIAWNLFVEGAAGTKASFDFDPTEKGPPFPGLKG